MNKGLTFDDVNIVPGYNPFPSRGDARIKTEISLGEGFNFSIPICSSNMDTVTGWEMAYKMGELGGLGILHRFCSIEENIQLYIQASEKGKYSSTIVGVSVGVNEGLDRAAALYEVGARIFCVDTAYGHSKVCGDMVKSLKQEFKDILIVAGNVVTFAGADYLVSCGADVIKVGVGSGSACLTRVKTGIGVPQLTAIIDCSKCSKPIIADGGIRTAGDACKALAAGATMVMLGGMLSGTDETPGEVNHVSDTGYHAKDFVNGYEEYKYKQQTLDTNLDSYKAYKVFRGMASKEANEDNFGVLNDWKTAEGISTSVECKGPVEGVIRDIMGGLRSCMTYVGASTIDELQRRATFMQVTQNGVSEAQAHILY